MKFHVSVFLLFLFAQELTFGRVIDSLKTRNYTNWYVGVHYAGNIGFISGQAGYHLSNRFSIAAGYGYLPEAVNGTEAHHLFIKSNFYFSNGCFYKEARWYIGANAIYAISGNTFFNFPSYYPDGYYPQNAIHFAPYLGIRLPFNFYKPIWAESSFFHMEMGTLDSYIWYCYENKQIHIWDICNLSFGFTYGLK